MEEKARYAGKGGYTTTQTGNDGVSPCPPKPSADDSEVLPRGVYATKEPCTTDRVEALEERINKLEALVHKLEQKAWPS